MAMQLTSLPGRSVDCDGVTWHCAVVGVTAVYTA